MNRIYTIYLLFALCSLGQAASLNDLVTQMATNLTSTAPNSHTQPHDSTISFQSNAHDRLEQKIQEEFQKTYGEHKRIRFVKWRLPRFKDPKTRHWDLSKSNQTYTPDTFRIDTIAMNDDLSKMKAKVFYTIDHTEKHFIVRGRVETLIDIPVLNRSVHYGDMIKETDIVWKKVSDNKAGRYLVLKPKDLVGRHPKGKYLKAGTPIYKQDIILPLFVEKGAYVTVLYQSGDVSLSLKGKALDQGYKGNTIRVLNETSHKIIHGTVEAPSIVHMTN